MDVPRLLRQQPAGLLVQPTGDGLVGLLRSHGHPVGGREIPLRQRIHRRLLHIGVLPRKGGVGQPAHRVAVLIDADPQAVDLLPQRFRVGGAQQSHHLLPCLAVRQLRQHPQRRIQADGRIHRVLPPDEDLRRRLIGKAPHRAVVRTLTLAQRLQALPVGFLRRGIGVPVPLAVLVDIILIHRLRGEHRIRRFHHGILRQIRRRRRPLRLASDYLYSAADRQHQRRQHAAQNCSHSFHVTFPPWSVPRL